MKKLSIKDLITLVILTILMIAISHGIGGILSFNLFATLVLAPGIVSFIIAPIFMLMAVRIKKRGVFLLYAILTGLPFLLAGFWFVIIYMVLVGLIGEFIYFKNVDNYAIPKRLVVFWPIYNIFWVGMSIIPVWFMKETYVKTAISNGFSKKYVDSLLSYYSTPTWMLLIWGFAFIGGLVGALLGKKLLKKHFSKSGVI